MASSIRAFPSLRHRLSNWWRQDRIRLPYAPPAQAVPRAGDRLQVAGRGFRLGRSVGGGERRFEAHDEQFGRPLTIELLETCYRFEMWDGEAVDIPHQEVLVFPTSWARDALEPSQNSAGKRTAPERPGRVRETAV